MLVNHKCCCEKNLILELLVEQLELKKTKTKQQLEVQGKARNERTEKIQEGASLLLPSVCTIQKWHSFFINRAEKNSKENWYFSPS